jgi:membrane-bound lytic murein transglycosylase A
MKVKRKTNDNNRVRAALTEVCKRALATRIRSSAQAREFFEKNFRATFVAKLDDGAGFVTGYYEPIIEGARLPSDDYSVPLYSRPSNLIASGKRKLADGFPNKGLVGKRIGRRKIGPYYDRTEIEEGALAGRKLEICWVKDPVDAFFAQIQGSVRVRLDTGQMLRLNYAAHNGHPYYPVGRALIERGIVRKEHMSMDKIRDWMAANPEGAKELRRMNPSYVFFRETGLPNHSEPTGGQGVPLTPGRSLAVDRSIHVYGTPFFVQGQLPIDSERSETVFQRLMIAQDTGSAIVGPARGDIYFGAGDEAGQIAGRIKNTVRVAMLIPRELDPMEAGKDMPLPPKRPDESPLIAFGPPSRPASAETASSGGRSLSYAAEDKVTEKPSPPGAKAKTDTKVAAAARVPLPRPRPRIGGKS